MTYDRPGDRGPDMPSLTYAELAQALKITPASANKLARRRRWPRVPGNDGKAIVRAARWRTGSRSARAICSPTAPRQPPCAPMQLRL